MNEKVFDNLLIKLEYILEADPRTFSNPICNCDYLFDAFGDLYRIIKKIDNMLAQHNGSAIDLIDNLKKVWTMVVSSFFIFIIYL